MEKWIIDTDPGTDDMFAILYLLNRPAIEILMIGTTDGNVSLNKTTENMKKILKWSGKSLKIYRGSAFPIIKIYENVESFHYCDGLGEIHEIMNYDASDIPVENENSALKYVELLSKYPGEINILAIGPLTNIATAFMLEPNITSLIKKIYIMGGSFNARGNHNCNGEFNLAYDFIAAKIVLDNFKKIIITPWEPTEFIKVTDKMMVEIKENLTIENKVAMKQEIHYYSSLIITKFTNCLNGLNCCDLYCAISSFAPSCINSFFIAKLDVNIDSKDLFGSLYIKKKKKISKDYSTFVNSEEFINMDSDFQLVIESFHEALVFKELEYIFL